MQGRIEAERRYPAQLAEKLAAMDIHETERNLNNKIRRGALVPRSYCNA
ncbi:DUF6471 domain-containing protein [Mesorhizobium sp.]